ncbi:MAG: hypothetical protein AABX53_03295 [Nanoarchaeota archaeon]
MRGIQERSRQEIDAKLATMGDYVKIDYLQRALSSGLDFDTKKHVMTILSRLYESKSMYLESARLLRNAADINTTFKAKINDFMKSIELYIKGGNYSEADFVFQQTLALATEIEKSGLRTLLKNYYAVEAKNFLRVDKRNQAKKAYEKLLTLELTAPEKHEAQQQLLALYEKLGNIRDYFKLKESMNNSFVR